MSKSKDHKSTIANLLLVVFSTIIAVLFVELMLHILDQPTPIVSGWRADVERKERNQLGFRGQQIEYSQDDYVVVLLGDSQVEAKACTFERMPEKRLQHHLRSGEKKNVKVFTLGAGGYGNDQQLLVLQEYYQTFRADLVVLWQTPMNDVWNNMFLTHWPANGWRKPTFQLEGEELHGPTEQMGEPIPLSTIRILAVWQRLFSHPDWDGEWEKYLPPPYRPMTEYKGQVSLKLQELWDSNYGRIRQENLDNEKSHFALALTPVSPRTRYGLQLTQRLLHEIDSLVEKQDGRFVIFNVEKPANDPRVFPPPVETVFILNEKYYRMSKTQLKENIRYINQEFQAYTIPVTVEKWRAGPQDGHLNEKTTNLVIKDFAKKLQPFLQ